MMFLFLGLLTEFQGSEHRECVMTLCMRSTSGGRGIRAHASQQHRDL
jgi:hypothetical protein